MNIWSALINPAFPFLRNAVLAALLSSVLFGVLGSLITVRRIGALAGAISHAVLGGIGLALFLSVRKIVPGFPPLLGALIFALLSALIIGFVSIKARQREDTIINAVWAVGMSLGVLFLSMTPGYADPMTYLFGNILIISTEELVLLAILDVIVVAALILWYPVIEATSFDSEFSRVRGLPVTFVYFAVLVVSALSIVLMQTFIGIVMVIAMLVLPGGTVHAWVKNLGAMMLGATAVSILSTLTGIYVSWVTDKPAGSVIVLVTAVVFGASLGLRFLVGKAGRRNNGKQRA
jgi:zinc transport system permease protein